MDDTLVETKLLLPRLRRDAVPRPRLAALLARARDARVTLVSAPAGFGKTTLLGAWLAAHHRPAASPGCRWTSATVGRRRSGPTSCSPSTVPSRGRRPRRSRCWAPDRRPSRPCSPGVVNELSVHDGEVTLVLDDYHLADGPDVAAGMTFLVDHLPPQLQLVISTRADPALPAVAAAGPRRAGRGPRGRPALRRRRGRRLPQRPQRPRADRRRRSRRSRSAPRAGWRRSSSRRSRYGTVTDASGFIDRFAGDDRFVVDYLVDEVLSRQPDDVRRFLLDTSILGRLTASLCEAVTGRSTGQRPSDARPAGPAEPLPRPAGRPPALVPLPPPVRRRPPHAPGPGASRRRPGAASPREPLVRRARATSRRPCGTPSPPATSTRQRSSSSWRSRRCAGTGARPSSGDGSTTCPTTWCATGPCSPAG